MLKVPATELISAACLRRWRGALCLSAICAILSLVSPAAADSTQESELKVAFLFNFLKLAEWPEPLGATVELCLAGHDPFGEVLGMLQGRQVQDKPVQVRILKKGEKTDGCSMLFIPGEDAAVRPWLEKASQAAVLTVSDSPGFIDEGGMIGLLTEDNKLRFEVNLEPVRRSGLKLRAQMLQLAVRVEGVKL